MKTDTRKLKKVYGIIAGISLVHWLLTFLSDNFVFDFPEKTESAYKYFVLDYTVCKIFAFLFLFALYTFVYKVFIDKEREGKPLYTIAKCGAPYLLLMLIITAVKLRHGYVTNDEYAILAMARNLEHNTWFTYITVYFYIISLMVIPFEYGPVFMKLIVEYITVGYVVYRFKNYFEIKCNNNLTGDNIISWEAESFIDRHHLRERILRGSRLKIKRDARKYEIKYYWLSYLIFLLYPVLAYTTSAHRLPVYFLIYLAVFVTLIFDRLEGNDLTLSKAVVLIFIGSVLTHWRTEGIYLLILMPIIKFLVYPNIRHRKAAVTILTLTLTFQTLVYIPQNVLGVEDLGASAVDRMKPFYAYTIVNMVRNGLDRVKNAEDLEYIDNYIAIDKIDAVNEHYDDINYEDTFILFEEFNGVREDATFTDYYEYTEAMKRIFINNPDVFIKTRIGAFVYAAVPYHISFGSGITGFIKGLFSVFKSVSYNIFIPFFAIIAVCIYALIKKRWCTFFMSGGLIAHWFIVFILAPASYFKYYFPIYICGYMYLMMMLIQTIYNKKALKKITFFN